MAEGLCTYEQFKENVREGIEAGTVKIPLELSELDLATQYVICHFWKDGIREITEEMIYHAIGKYCGEDVRRKCFT